MATVTTDASSDTTCFVTPQFSTTAVAASASRVIGSLPLLDEFAVLVYNQVHQEQIVAEQERVQQRIAEQIVHVSAPQIQEQIVESVQVIPRELFPGPMEEIAEVVQNVSSGAFPAKHCGADCRRSCATGCGGTARRRRDEPDVSGNPKHRSNMVAPAPPQSFAALDPAVLDGFQQALVSIGVSDVSTLTKQHSSTTPLK